MRKPKDKDKLLQKIQKVFDGELTVEELLTQEDVTLAKSKDIGVIKRHI